MEKRQDGRERTGRENGVREKGERAGGGGWQALGKEGP